MAVQVAAALVPAQVALEARTDVVQLVEEGDELLVERLVEEARQAERDEVEHLVPIDEIALDLMDGPGLLAAQLTVTETQRRHPRLQTVGQAVACLHHAEQDAANV